MKEILFIDSDDHELMGKNARRMMAHLSISADEDVQQTLAFFEKVGTLAHKWCCIVPWQMSMQLLSKHYYEEMY